jgi:DNA-binding NarL/FixJ family response regulator
MDYSLKILIVDEVSMFTSGLTALLKSKWNDSQVHVTSNHEEALHTARKGATVVLISSSIVGLDAFDLARRITKDTESRSRVLFMLDTANVEAARRAIEAKMYGVFLKSDTEEELYRAITMVSAGRTYTPPSMTGDLINRDSKDGTMDALTLREKTTLTLMAQGFLMKQIADRMGVSVKTAETHRNNLGRKLGYPTKAQLIVFALKRGLISEEQMDIIA